LDNPKNPIEIKEESAAMGIQNPLENNDEEDESEEDDKEEEEEEEEVVEEEEEVEIVNNEEEEEDVHCVGGINYDQNRHLVERKGNFCIHYSNCPIHKSPIINSSIYFEAKCFRDI